MMADERFGNYSSCCRLCLSEQFAALKPIFENEGDGTFLVQQILTFLGVEIAQGDKVSTMICNRCRNRIKSWDEFKKSCSENQRKLQTWLNGWVANGDIPNMSIHIKDEPVEHESIREETNGETVVIKIESSEVDDEYYDDPPVLSPHRPLGEEVLVTITEIQPKKLLNCYEFEKPSPKITKSNKDCSYCGKSFCSSGNRARHERNNHADNETGRLKTSQVLSASALTNQEDTSQHSVDSQISRNGSVPPSLDSEADLSESDAQKIQFAAGLRLKSKTVGSDASKSDEASITKVEEAYVERSKALLSMLYSARCACHNIHYNTAKRLFGHLRANYNWFPIFTCHNCLITFGQRSGLMRHIGKCPKPYLENCIRLAQSKKRVDNKIRLYQYYKCSACDLFFAFHDDYQRHIDAEHIGNSQLTCKCSKLFATKEEFTKHVYVSCYLHYYCDVCYTSCKSLGEFRQHCEKKHDKVDDCSFVEYHEDFKLVDPMEILRSRKRKYPEVEPDREVDKMNEAKKFILSVGKKEIKQELRDIKIRKMELVTRDSDSEIDETNLNASYNLRSPSRSPRRYSKYKKNGWKNQPSQCPDCDREFSTYYNMIRHQKTHDESEKQLQCSFCVEKFRLMSELKDHLNVTHGEAHICQECGKQFGTFKELDQHRSVHLNIKVYRDSETLSYRTKPRYSCEECDEAFETERELKQHIPTHFVKVEAQNGISDSKRSKHSCQECDRHYLSVKGLWLHNKRHHPNRKVPQQSYKCDICDKVCSTNAAFQSHKSMHFRNTNVVKKQEPPPEPNDEDDDYFTCKRCFKVFSTKYNLRTHLKTHGVNVAGGRSGSKTGKATKTFWCDICHQACQGYQELQKHKEEHVNENLGETDSVEDDVDVKPNIKTCEICSKIFVTHLGFVKHKQKHERQNNVKIIPIKKGNQKGTNLFLCKYCKVSFPTSNALCDHMVKEHDELKQPKQIKQEKLQPKKFPCNMCKKVFESSGALCSHQGWHKREQNLRLKELKAQQEANENRMPVLKPEGKIRHFKQEPQPTTSFQARNTCKNCGLSFATDTALQIHILEVHRNVNATLISPKCTICQLDFSTNEAYDEHQKLHSMPQMLFKCKYCPRTFPKCAAVNMHINSVHPQYTDGKIKCHECNRNFEKQNALAMHLKVHDRQKLAMATVKEPKPTKVYSCSICFASFEIAKDLRNHIITTHPF